MSVKVILKKNVDKVGMAGEIKQVAPGFARNYLLPRGLATEATEQALAAFKRGETKRKSEQNKELDAAKAQGAKMEGTTLTFTRATAEEGKIFGSVGKGDIAKGLKAAGFEGGAIVLESPIKALGEHTVEVKLHQQVTTKIKVSVLAKAA